MYKCDDLMASRRPVILTSNFVLKIKAPNFVDENKIYIKGQVAQVFVTSPYPPHPQTRSFNLTAAMCRLPCRLNPPHSLSLWNGMPHLVEEIAYHLYDDTPTLQHLALTARVFGVAAQKTLFKNFDLLDEAAVYKWRIRMIEFSAYHGPDTAPFFFRHIKHFSFTLGTNQFRASYIIDFINRVKGRLTGLETVDIYGYDGLSCLWPPCGWFSSFINTTRPIALSFNGTLVPEYILEFGFSSLRSIHFNVCRIYYLDEDNKHKEARQPTLDAKLRLRQGGTRWERVEEIISSALNCETMRLVKDGVEIDSLGLRSKSSTVLNFCFT